MMENKKALISGCNGQDGSYLAELLLAKNYKVYGMIRRSSVDTTERIAHLISNTNFELIEGDVTDASCMHRLISGIQPTEVYNLAAMSHVGVSFNQPITTCHINAVGPLNILEAIRQSSPKTKFYQASTSELFGDTKISPQNENIPFNPNSPYAIAKLYAHNLVGLYRRAYGIFACAGILFNHESPRRGKAFVTRKITQYVAMLQNWIDVNGRIPRMDWEDTTVAVDSPQKRTLTCAEIPPLALGNIDAKRDWSHAEDMVRGMWMIMQHDTPDDYVLGSGKPHSVKELLQVAFGTMGLDYKDYVVIDPKFYRPVDVNLLHADSTKAKKILGWVPTISFGEMIDCMVQNDYRMLIECPV
ncbi:MAG: GDP-mannose 4,6-dehydratase [Candidatus Neomarinimicrobiota bacterium]